MRMLAAALLVSATACTVTDEGDLADPVTDRAPIGAVAVSHDMPRSSEAPPFELSPMRVKVTNLTADLQGMAAHRDPKMIDPWGLAFDADASGGPRMWIAVTGTDVAACTDASGATAAPSVAITGAPTSVVYTPTPALAEFDNDELVFSTESGTIAAWSTGGGAKAVVRVDGSAGGANYKGLAITTKGLCNKVVAANFHAGTVDTFADDYALQPTTYVDPNVPAGYAPFNVAAFGTQVYVAYAMQDAAGHDDVPGAGHGFIDVFAHEGTFQRRLISGGHLNSPWGMTMVPAGWGALSNMLLIGNYGDGEINVYDPQSGDWKGRLVDENDVPIVLDGLWGIEVGPKTATVDLSDRIFFTAGPGGERHGVVGSISLL